MSRDLTPGERRARLQTFGPTGAAFVFHLVGCERCRGHAEKLLGPGEEREGGDILLHLTRGGYLLSLAGEAPEGDLPLVELQKFLGSLSPEQAAFIRHLLACERCRRAVAKTLKPPAVANRLHGDFHRRSRRPGRRVLLMQRSERKVSNED